MVRMLTDQPFVKPKDEMQPELCEEAAATLKPTFPKRNSFHIEKGKYVCWKEYYLACQQDSKCGRLVWKEKEILYHLEE